MRLPRTRLTFHRLLVALAIASTAAHSAAPGQDVPRASKPDDALDGLTQRSAAARLLTAMGPYTSTDTKVARLIDRLVLRDREQVQAAVTALTMLGASAVPSIIQRIDDRREAVHGVAFENRGPNAFEAVRQYGSAKVVDLLNLVLEDITSESFGFIDISMDFDLKDQRAADAQRAQIIAGWRRYVARGKTAPRAPGKALPRAQRPA